MSSILQTERLILRPWKKEDFEPFAELNADPRVMEYFPGLISREESDRFATSIVAHFQKYGWGLWAVSLVNGAADFIGFIGLRYDDFNASFTPAVEIGWRLAYPFWHQGYATEGAKEALKHGFETVGLNEIVSFTAVQNIRSRAVMERIGMNHTESDDFDNPKIPEGHPLRRHVLYRLNRETWKKID